MSTFPTTTPFVPPFKSDDGIGIALAVQVPANARQGHPIALGNAGFFGIPRTPRATAETIASGQAAAGLRAGEATTYFPGVGMAIRVGTLPNDIALWSKVYQAPDGTYTGTEGGNLFVGWRFPRDMVGVRYNS
ncbi:hypothetical protein [Deinococcus multiflagellatus]|uniref:DUF2190 family protein n=1 Tax=Deinococcus multiflagellatus TaxID=1656887 RepID=A0ABW1ZQZ6_9DEIO|nr:hypothetical protein [Deinococcus multiflagellatus]MBZ9715282.1 hypothetical protein [Deinococcus multiflagellatus]